MKEGREGEREEGGGNERKGRERRKKNKPINKLMLDFNFFSGV